MRGVRRRRESLQNRYTALIHAKAVGTVGIKKLTVRRIFDLILNFRLFRSKKYVF